MALYACVVPGDLAFIKSTLHSNVLALLPLWTGGRDHLHVVAAVLHV